VKSDRVFAVLESVEATTLAQMIADSGTRLTALIPDYVAQTSTVIGTPPEGVPVAYDSLESRYRHTLVSGHIF
jgi:hypothetical protein